MDTSANTPADDRPQSETSDEMVRELTRKQQDLTEAMQRLIRFQRQTLVLKNAPSIDVALDSMESLLIEVIDFAYASLQYRSDGGAFSPLRQICPENIHLDYPLMEWVMGTQEVSVLPIEFPLEDGKLRSLLFLPFGTHHILLLWLEQETDAFTQEQEALLSILSREMAAVLDSHHFRVRLEKARDAMSDLIESVPLGLLALDHHGKILMLNSTAETTLDVRRQDVVGADYNHALPEKVAGLIASLAKDGVRDEVELSIDRGRGEDQYLGLTLSPMRSEDAGANKSGWVVVCRDLQLSHEVEKLRELDAMKNDFLSLVTHELRTPLTSIMAYSETLMLDDSEAVPAEWREYIDTIYSEGKRLSRLVDDVLDLTRMEAGKMTYVFEEQDPNEVIGSVVMSVTAAIEEKGIDLELDLGEDLGLCSMAVDRFTQALANTVANAVKFTPSGGRITVRSRLEKPIPGSQIPTLLVTVEDTGVGIAPEHLDKVFSKFEIMESVKHHTSGSGLSMAISRQIVEEGHRGRIWIESEPGKGTKVYMQIPTKHLVGTL